ETGVVLIFDEVITGFRIALGGAQEYYGVQADMTTLGKLIGGGFPVGAYGGKQEIMECISPLGPAVQAGTLSGNPVAMSAGIATLKALKEPGLYERLDAHATKLAAGIGAAAKSAGVDLVCNRVASMMTNFFTTTPVTCADDLEDCDVDKYGKFFHAMLSRGVAFAPSYCEAAFVSNAHTDADIATTIEMAEEAFGEV
ncbi:MAG TPA: aminotransferase class III-fold pyridoxal phosphate-dependent enzyme, partial [Armatimonadota bacterium]|nr:aminotransferase class III-fold pyridoxal phosphate-dependent enzyme [Armatimonadota bacterium]